MRGVARAARRKYSRFAGQLQPLAKARVTWFEKSGRDLVRLSAVELIRPADPLLRDLEGILLAGCIADQMLAFAQENEESGRLYRLLDSTLEALIAGVDRRLALRYLEIWVLRLSGIFPVPRECPGCGADLARAGAMLPASGEGLLCRSCAGREPGALEAGPEVLELLRRSGAESLTALARRPPTARALEGAEEICGRVRRAFLQQELKSYRVMQETLAGLPGG